VAKAGPNRLLVTLSGVGPIQRISWTPDPSFAIELADGTPVLGGVLTPPANSTRPTFILRRLGTGSLTVPLTIDGTFGTWRTFVGGGPNAW